MFTGAAIPGARGGGRSGAELDLQALNHPGLGPRLRVITRAGAGVMSQVMQNRLTHLRGGVLPRPDAPVPFAAGPAAARRLRARAASLPYHAGHITFCHTKTPPTTGAETRLGVLSAHGRALRTPNPRRVPHRGISAGRGVIHVPGHPSSTSRDKVRRHSLPMTRNDGNGRTAWAASRAGHLRSKVCR
jgi:hypothetical protein